MVMKTFLNHFDVDRAVYIRYSERVPQVLYNDTEKEMNAGDHEDHGKIHAEKCGWICDLQDQQQL